MAFRITFDKIAAPKFRQNLAGLHDRFQTAFRTAINMAASMIETKAREDIANAGNFGSRWISALTTTVENMRISMTLDVPYADIFVNGGTITGNPLLWLPLSGTDAEGVQPKDYGGLFSVNRKSGGVPLLFSIADHAPKYFGVPSVTIPQKFHFREIEEGVMADFRNIFDTAFRATE